MSFTLIFVICGIVLGLAIGMVPVYLTNRYQRRKAMGEISVEKQKKNTVTYHVGFGVWFMGLGLLQLNSRRGEEIPWWVWMWIASALMYFIAAYRLYVKEAKPIEYDRVYKNDPTKCGKCGYDVVHIQSASCPECGWTLPNLDEVRLQSHDVWCWWKKGNWQIVYLEEDMRKKAQRGFYVTVVMEVIVACVIGLWLLSKEGGWHSFSVPVIFLVFLSLLSIHKFINVHRIRKYYERVDGEK
ncbi:hypothetical protein [Poriferisphaera corsica]|nr:hypothetical protein [Poriferisphaera corsica]